MGRYYVGDIEGKFMFGVQSSNCADRFGYIGEPTYLTYNFDESHLPQIEDELDRIRLCTLGEDKLNKLNEFFKDRGAYNHEELAKYLSIDKSEVVLILSEYADYKMGLEIKKCIEENGDCFFEAEL